MSKVEQSLGISFSDIADYLKEKYNLPEDIKVSNVEKIPGTNMYSVVIYIPPNYLLSSATMGELNEYRKRKKRI